MIDGPTTRWVIVSGEYPPASGGVADYSYTVAHSLAERGDEVHVFAPIPCDAGTPAATGERVSVHGLDRGFGLRGLRQLSRALRDIPRPYRLLVQYVPQAFGWRGMNVAFAAWLLARAGDDPWVMFHEVYFPLRRGQPVRHVLLGAVTRLMAAAAARGAGRVFVSTSAWVPMIGALAPRAPAPHWLPVPASVEGPVDASRRDALRAAFQGLGRPAPLLVGHFGSYAGAIRGLLRDLIPHVLQVAQPRRMVLIGRGSEQFADELRRDHPPIAPRVLAAGTVPRDDLAAHIAACDLMLQPYIDGVTTRRTTAMAGMALGVPVVTTRGALTESIWTDDVVMLAPVSIPAIVERVDALAHDEVARARVAAAAQRMYAERFSVSTMVDVLRRAAAEPPRALVRAA